MQAVRAGPDSLHASGAPGTSGGSLEACQVGPAVAARGWTSRSSGLEHAPGRPAGRPQCAHHGRLGAGPGPCAEGGSRIVAAARRTGGVVLRADVAAQQALRQEWCPGLPLGPPGLRRGAPR
eukprot:110651-Lingulodinium_polyedra.AAC.1